MNNINAESELSVIKKIMEDSRKIVLDNGVHYIFWGVVVTAAVLINYAMILMSMPGKYIGLMWMILMVLAAITDGIIGAKQSKTTRVRTFAGDLLGSLWMASGIAMFIFGFIGTVSKAYNPIYICPIISTALGISYFTSGAIQQLKWLQYIAYGWWAGAMVMYFLPGAHTFLIFAFMMISFQIIPGIILNAKFKKSAQEHVNAV